MTDRAILLRDYLADQRGRAFRPGRHDCALFAAGWVRACTGRDLAEEWTGRYASLDDGRAMLEAAGIAGPVELAAQHLDDVPGWMHARVGDIAVVQEAGYPAFGIVGGAYIHVLSLRGLDVVPVSRALRVLRP